MATTWAVRHRRKIRAHRRKRQQQRRRSAANRNGVVIKKSGVYLVTGTVTFH